MLTRTLRTTATAAARRATQQQNTLISTMTRRCAPLSTTTQVRAATSQHDNHGAATGHEGGGDHGGHESHYDVPGGWLWGIPPGEKRQREGWEIPFFGFYCTSIVIAVVAVSLKEDTSIQTWALEEARRRLEKEGILEDKFPESK